MSISRSQDIQGQLFPNPIFFVMYIQVYSPAGVIFTAIGVLLSVSIIIFVSFVWAIVTSSRSGG